MLRSKFWGHFEQLKEQSRTLFVTTQYVGEAAYCDYVGVMADGRLLMVDTPEGLRGRALGGHVLRIKPERLLDYNQLTDLRAAPFVRQRQVTVNPDLSLQLVVDDAGTALPAVMSWMDEQGVTVTEAGEYNPPFDEVFVMLLEQETARQEGGDNA